jgi:hypothetical protein
MLNGAVVVLALPPVIAAAGGPVTLRLAFFSSDRSLSYIAEAAIEKMRSSDDATS